jgi:3-dehydroquinate synthase
MTKKIRVTGTNGYEILVGRHLLDEVAPSLGSQVNQVLIVHPEPLTTSAEALKENLDSKGYKVSLATVPDGEESKSIAVVSFLWQVLGQNNFTRSDAIIALGGGATTDLGGFAAATWLRGIKLINIPTTLLGMVDASVGGKTAINTVEGKNLVGSFYAPSLVIADLETLTTLPRFDILAGFAEVAKYGFISDETILDAIEDDVEKATDPSSTVFFDLVCKSIEIKAKVVSEDFKETGTREYLNYGHTLGHAIEHAERYKWRHGAAISIGMVFAAELALLSGKLSVEAVDRHRHVFNLLGLPITYKSDAWIDLFTTMQRDKKARGNNLRFIVLDSIGHPSVLTAPAPELLFSAYQEILD